MKSHKMCILAHSICTLAVLFNPLWPYGQWMRCFAFCHVMRGSAVRRSVLKLLIVSYCCCQNFSSGVSSEWRTAAHARFIKMQFFILWRQKDGFTLISALQKVCCSENTLPCEQLSLDLLLNRALFFQLYHKFVFYSKDFYLFKYFDEKIICYILR